MKNNDPKNSASQEERDEDIRALLGKLAVPKAASNLEYRILEAARLSDKPIVQPQHGAAWWRMLFAPAMARSYAYVMAAVIFVVSATLWMWPEYEKYRHYEIAYERYTVDGVPLLDDVAVVEEPATEISYL